MSYEKQTWVTGETITASKLNHMEDGIEALSKEYDFILYYNINEEATPPFTISALGISPDDLFDKITENGVIKTVCIATHNALEGEVFYLPSDCTIHINDTLDDLTALSFKYNKIGGDFQPNIEITDNGLAVCSNYNGTYTYSDGEYEFTFSSEPPQ